MRALMRRSRPGGLPNRATTVGVGTVATRALPGRGCACVSTVGVGASATALRPTDTDAPVPCTMLTAGNAATACLAAGAVVAPARTVGVGAMVIRLVPPTAPLLPVDTVGVGTAANAASVAGMGGWTVGVQTVATRSVPAVIVKSVLMTGVGTVAIAACDGRGLPPVTTIGVGDVATAVDAAAVMGMSTRTGAVGTVAIRLVPTADVLPAARTTGATTSAVAAWLAGMNACSATIVGVGTLAGHAAAAGAGSTSTLAAMLGIRTGA